jgi:hypothetical protein
MSFFAGLKGSMCCIAAVQCRSLIHTKHTAQTNGEGHDYVPLSLEMQAQDHSIGISLNASVTSIPCDRRIIFIT